MAPIVANKSASNLHTGFSTHDARREFGYGGNKAQGTPNHSALLDWYPLSALTRSAPFPSSSSSSSSSGSRPSSCIGTTSNCDVAFVLCWLKEDSVLISYPSSGYRISAPSKLRIPSVSTAKSRQSSFSTPSTPSIPPTSPAKGTIPFALPRCPPPCIPKAYLNKTFGPGSVKKGTPV